jgi:hypothetical protein
VPPFAVRFSSFLGRMTRVSEHPSDGTRQLVLHVAIEADKDRDAADLVTVVVLDDKTVVAVEDGIVGTQA